MHRPIRTVVYVISIFVALESAVAAADLFQWTDPSGVIHFTDNPYTVPESVHKSGRLLVRKGFLVNSQAFNEISVPPAPVQPSVNAETKDDSAADSKQSEPTSLTYSPQEINVVIVNTNIRRPKLKSCGAGQSCKPRFRPDFNDRQYIHPSVFNGGPRQYIHP